MKIMAWNLNHRASEGRLKPGIAEAVKRIQPDLLVLNEYVHGDTRMALLDDLTRAGLCHVLVSTRLNGNNQVLIASRLRLDCGNLVGPHMPDAGGTSNFLHVCVPELGIEVVGVRAPAYKKSAERRDYWLQLRKSMDGSKDRPIAFVGDLNADPKRARDIGGRHLAALCADGWSIPNAVGDWSYASGTRVDHAVLAPNVCGASAEYVATIDGLILARRGDRTAISDHAALVVRLELPNAPQQQVPPDVLASGASPLQQGRG